jgi:circadian clock protein KaiC
MSLSCRHRADVRYFETVGAVRRAVSVIKKRSGMHEDTIREMFISSQGVQVGPPLTGLHGVLTAFPTLRT